MLYIREISDILLTQGGETSGFLTIGITFANKGDVPEGMYAKDAFEDILYKAYGTEVLVCFSGTEPLEQNTSEFLHLLSMLRKQGLATQLVTNGEHDKERIVRNFDFVSVIAQSTPEVLQINLEHVTSLAVIFPKVNPTLFKSMRINKKYLVTEGNADEKVIDALKELGFGWAHTKG